VTKESRTQEVRLFEKTFMGVEPIWALAKAYWKATYRAMSQAPKLGNIAEVCVCVFLFAMHMP
jgi:hypothetical protein